MGNKTLSTSWQMVYDGPGLANLYCAAAIQLAYGDSPGASEIATWPAGIPLYLPERRNGLKVYAKVSSGTPALQIVA